MSNLKTQIKNKMMLSLLATNTVKDLMKQQLNSKLQLLESQ